MISGERLPIAETFHSVQGEGTFVGTPMHFIRLAGCNVGKPAAAVRVDGPLPILPSGEEAKVCVSWDGRTFYCDTDYNKHDERTIKELVDDTWEQHICLTGGEPFLHQKHFDWLWALASERGIMVHIESSGTIMPTNWPPFWVTCAPKLTAHDQFIKKASELKLLVDEHFHSDNLTPAMLEHHNVFLCPINDVTEHRQKNIDLCYVWLHKFPHWRMGSQMHKYWGLR